MHSLEPFDKWEYRSDAFELRSAFEAIPASVVVRMNELGAGGWELVSTSIREHDPTATMLCVFKRRRVE